MSQVKAAMKNIFPVNQEKFREGFSNKYFDSLRGVAKNDDDHYQESFVRMAPVGCSVESLYKFENYLKSADKLLSAAMDKELKIALSRRSALRGD